MKRELSRPYIMLDGNGIVRNIAMFMNYEDANKITRAVYGDNAVAEEYKWLVSAGDKKKNGVYYMVGLDGLEEPAEYIPTEEEKINQLTSDNATLKHVTADLQSTNDDLTIALSDVIGGAVE